MTEREKSNLMREAELKKIKKFYEDQRKGLAEKTVEIDREECLKLYEDYLKIKNREHY